VKSKHWIATLAFLLISSNVFHIYNTFDNGVTITYLESSFQQSNSMYGQVVKLANLNLIGLPSDEAIKIIGKDEDENEPFVKDGCIYASQVCVRLNKINVVEGIGSN